MTKFEHHNHVEPCELCGKVDQLGLDTCELTDSISEAAQLAARLQGRYGTSFYACKWRSDEAPAILGCLGCVELLFGRQFPSVLFDAWQPEPDTVFGTDNWHWLGTDGGFEAAFEAAYNAAVEKNVFVVYMGFYNEPCWLVAVEGADTTTRIPRCGICGASDSVLSTGEAYTADRALVLSQLYGHDFFGTQCVTPEIPNGGLALAIRAGCAEEIIRNLNPRAVLMIPGNVQQRPPGFVWPRSGSTFEGILSGMPIDASVAVLYANGIWSLATLEDVY